MSQPNSKFNDFDYTPSRERRGPAPITNFPGNALGGDVDPTRELRALIEQLQQSARDARSQLQNAVSERDDLAAQVEHLRRQNEELRTHFVEITSLIRERDTALADVERLSRAATEAQSRLATAQRELNDAQRQRDDAVRQRDDLTRARDDINRQREEALRQREELRRQMDAATRAAQDANQRFSDVQRQLLSIRQARDAAQAQNTALAQKVAASGERLNEYREQLEFAEKALEEARTKSADSEQLASLREAYDAVQQQLLEGAAEIEQLRAKVTELTEQNATVLEAGNAHATALAEAQEQIARLASERDQAYAEIEAKDRLIQEIRTNPDEASSAELDEARREIAAFKAEREANDVRHQLLTREVMEMRQQLQARAEQLTTVQRTLDETSLRMARTQAQFDQLTQERNSAVSLREEATTSLSAAQKQIERIIRERDLIRQQSTENTIAFEAQIDALLAQLTAYEASDPAGGSATAEIRHLADRLALSEEERRELAERLDRQRGETIDLGAQLQAAQEQIRELSASLAEARLQALSSGSRSTQKRTTSESSSVTTPPRLTEVFDVGEVVSAMRQAHQAFLKDSSDLSLLGDIAAHAQLYAELAGASGLNATQSVSAAFAGLTQELFHYPEQITPAVLRTVQQGVDFLATLPMLPNLAQAKDPATATVFAVDDDADTCECIHHAMETAMMRTVSIQDPAKALCELGSTPCDLIFLDVNMPGMDGFELCAAIRKLALHTTTPVIFLTGLATAENRVQSNLSGGDEFVGKPYLLCELTLKALMLMMKAQLHLA